MNRAFSLFACSAAALAIGISTQSAHAAGVTAGTLIENTATATYTSGASSGSIESNKVVVRVDELLDVAVAGLTATPVPTGSVPVVLSYSITNTGNGPEAFYVTADPAVSGNDFNAVIQSIAVDTNGNGVYDAGIDQILLTGAATPAINPDTALTVFVIATLPATATDGQASQIRLTSDSVTGTGTPGTVFAGQGQGGGDAVAGSSTARDDGLGSLIATLATVTLTKSAAVADPFAGEQPVPGAVITYSIVATTTGTGAVDDLHVTDIIPAGTTYQPGTLKLEGAGLTDTADADAGTASASGIDVNLGTIVGGSTRTVTFAVKIN